VVNRGEGGGVGTPGSGVGEKREGCYIVQKELESSKNEGLLLGVLEGEPAPEKASGESRNFLAVAKEKRAR